MAGVGGVGRRDEDDVRGDEEDSERDHPGSGVAGEGDGGCGRRGGRDCWGVWGRSPGRSMSTRAWGMRALGMF